MSNKRHIPAELKDTSEREENSTVILYEKEKKQLVMISYVVNTKKKKKKKNVLALTTMRPLLGVTKDDGKVKPAPLKTYDHTKGGTQSRPNQNAGLLLLLLMS